MVRFERLLWEKVVNIKAFGRERTLAAPRKAQYVRQRDLNGVIAHSLFNTGMTAAFFSFIEPLLAYILYKYPRDICSQRGLSWEDMFLHQDRELRRCVFFEHVVRTSAHPYEWLLYKKRRGRYYKVERALRGFYVPEYIRKEAEERNLIDYVRNQATWTDFVYDNFHSDMTPTPYASRGKLLLIEYLVPYGLLRGEAWERYFYNEAVYDEVTREELDQLDMEKSFDFTTPNGKAKFESYVNRYISIYPGAIVPEGQEFNFNKFYASYAVAHGLDTSKYDQKLIGELRQKLEEHAAYEKEPTGDKKVGKSNVGTVFPAQFRSTTRSAFMNVNSQ